MLTPSAAWLEAMSQVCQGVRVERRVDFEFGDTTLQAVTGIDRIGESVPSILSISPRKDSLNAWSRKSEFGERTIVLRADGWWRAVSQSFAWPERWVRVYKGTADLDPNLWLLEWIGKINTVSINADGQMELGCKSLEYILEQATISTEPPVVPNQYINQDWYIAGLHPLEVIKRSISSGSAVVSGSGFSIFACDIDSFDYTTNRETSHFSITRAGENEVLPLNGEIIEPIKVSDVVDDLMPLCNGTIRPNDRQVFGYVPWDSRAEPLVHIPLQDIVSCKQSGGEIINRYTMDFAPGRGVMAGKILNTLTGQWLARTAKVDGSAHYTVESVQSQEHFAARGEVQAIREMREGTDWVRTYDAGLHTIDADTLGFSGSPTAAQSSLVGGVPPGLAGFSGTRLRGSIGNADALGVQAYYDTLAEGRVCTIITGNGDTIECDTVSMIDRETLQAITQFGRFPLNVTMEIIRRQMPEEPGLIMRGWDATIPRYRGEYIIGRCAYGAPEIELEVTPEYGHIQIGDFFTFLHPNFVHQSQIGADSTVIFECCGVQDDSGGDSGLITLIGVYVRTDDIPLSINPDLPPIDLVAEARGRFGGPRIDERFRDATVSEQRGGSAVIGMDMIPGGGLSVDVSEGHVDGDQWQSPRWRERTIYVPPEQDTYTYLTNFGHLYVHSVDNGADAPSRPFGAAFLGIIISDATDVTEIRDRRNDNPTRRYGGRYRTADATETLGLHVAVPDNCGGLVECTIVANVAGADGMGGAWKFFGRVSANGESFEFDAVYTSTTSGLAARLEGSGQTGTTAGINAMISGAAATDVDWNIQISLTLITSD